MEIFLPIFRCGIFQQQADVFVRMRRRRQYGFLNF
jgi:hypothetical protein